MNLNQFEEAIGHGGGSHAGPAQAREHGNEIISSVEAVFELGEVTWNMLTVDRPVGADNRGLDVAQRGVDPLEGRFARCRWTASGLDGLVGASGIGHPGETLKPVADDRAAWTEAALGKRRQCLVGETADASQLETDRLAIRCGLDRGDEWCLS